MNISKKRVILLRTTVGLQEPCYSKCMRGRGKPGKQNQILVPDNRIEIIELEI